MTQGEEPMDQKPCLKEDSGQDPKEDGRNQGSDVWTQPREWVPGLYRQIRACIGDVTNTKFCKCLTSKVTISVYVLIMIVLVEALVAVLVIRFYYVIFSCPAPPGSAGVRSLDPPACPTCPDGWFRNQGKCYYFSEVEGNWTDSQTNCSGFGASLAVFDSEQEKTFLLRYINKLNHWLGLRREQGQPWKRVNSTEFNLWFGIKGGGDCAYLSPAFVGSSRCSSHAHWICSKQDEYTVGKGRKAKDMNI